MLFSAELLIDMVTSLPDESFADISRYEVPYAILYRVLPSGGRGPATVGLGHDAGDLNRLQTVTGDCRRGRFHLHGDDRYGLLDRRREFARPSRRILAVISCLVGDDDRVDGGPVRGAVDRGRREDKPVAGQAVASWVDRLQHVRSVPVL